MEVAEAFDLIARSIDAGAVANGYLLCGDLRGSCDELTNLILRKLFPDAPEQIERRCHPDVIYLEPEGARRSIHTDTMRDVLIEPMSVTAFSGGWKVGVVVSADRMETAAANSFLKTLEEPPPKTLFLLQTDAPDSILPTIVSRCQRIDLPLSEGGLTGEAYEAVAEIFSTPGLNGVFEKARAGKRLAAILAELKGRAKDDMEKDPSERGDALVEDVALVRKAFYKTIMGFVRRFMVEDRLPRHLAFRNVEAVENAFRQSEKSMNDEAVLCFMMDRLTLP